MTEDERFLEARPEWTQRSDAEQAAFREYLPLSSFANLCAKGWLIEVRPYGPRRGWTQGWGLWLVRQRALAMRVCIVVTQALHARGGHAAGERRR